MLIWNETISQGNKDVEDTWLDKQTQNTKDKPTIRIQRTEQMFGLMRYHAEWYNIIPRTKKCLKHRASYGYQLPDFMTEPGIREGNLSLGWEK